MSKKEIQSLRNQYRRQWLPSSHQLEIDRFIGVSLSGGKNDKTAVCLLDYYPTPHKLFLRTIIEKIEESDQESADEKLLAILNKSDSSVRLMAFDVPITLPHCFSHHCKGIKKCESATMKWHWKNYRLQKSINKNTKLFTPYTERCVDAYVANRLEEKFPISHTLGANCAPLTARAHFLRNKIKHELIEVYPRLSFWRMGLNFKLHRAQLKLYKHSAQGEKVRENFLKYMVEQNIIFIYEQDIHKLLTRTNVFDAFLCAVTAFLAYKNQTEYPPKGFPAQEGWIEFPKIDFTF